MTTMQKTASAAEVVCADKVVESLVLRGDLSALGPRDRARYYIATCESLGLNPHSQPFEFLRLNGKEIMYARRGATDQLAAIHKLTREIIDGPKVIDLAGTKLVYAVCRATHPNGRTETATATVPLIDPPNVLMKCETKAKRRATLSILGLGMLDETELDTIPANAKEMGGGVDLGVLDASTRPTQPAPGHALPARGNVDARPELPPPPVTDPLAAALADVSSERPASLRSLATVTDAVPVDDDAARAEGERAKLRLALLEQVARCTTPGAVAELWVASREDRFTLSAADVEVVWKASINRVKEHQRSTDAGAKSWLKKAVAQRTDPTPPDDGTNGPTKPRSARETTATGNAAANDGARADGAVACVRDPLPMTAGDLRRHLDSKTCVTALENSLRKHAAELTADACSLYAQRYAVLWATLPGNDGRTLHPRSARQWVDGVLAQVARSERRAA